MPEIVIWGRRPPPLGGVTRCVEGLSRGLHAAGVDHVVVDWRQRRALWQLLTARRALHVHNVSSVLRFGFVILAKFVSGARSIVYFHSGTLPDQLRSPLRRRLARLGFRYVDEVWATNGSLAAIIADLSGVDPDVVSPFSVTPAPKGRAHRAPNSALFFVGFGKELYGASTVYAAMRAPALAEWSWTLVVYGDEESCDRAGTEAEARGCRVVVNLDAPGVLEVLAQHEVLVRPTTADGDAMVVREALALGTRVVASDVVPRPAGVELFDGSVGGLVRALSAGGLESDGTGLGRSVLEETQARLARTSEP